MQKSPLAAAARHKLRKALRVLAVPVPVPATSCFLPTWSFSRRAAGTFRQFPALPHWTQHRFGQPTTTTTTTSLALTKQCCLAAPAFSQRMSTMSEDREQSMMSEEREQSTMSEEREQDFNPKFPYDVFTNGSGAKRDFIGLPRSVRNKLSNPDGITFPRVDQFDRFLDYTPYDDPEGGYPDLGVSFPRVRVPGRFTVQPKLEDPIEILQATSGVDANYYRGLFRRVVDVRFRNIHTPSGKLAKMRVTVIVGDGNGNAGLGFGECTNTRRAARLAYVMAYRQMESFHVYDKRTLLCGGEHKYKASTVNFKAKRPGYGKRVHHVFYDICTAIGIRDVGGRVRGSRNRNTQIRAFFSFLRSQKLPRDLARARGVKLTDLMHIYYGRPQEL